MKTSRHKPQGCSPSDHRNYRRHEDGYAAFCGKRRRQWFTFSMSNLPQWACCYVVYLGGELVYVGMTENLEKRFRAHVQKSKWIAGQEVVIKAKLSRRFGDWAMTEIRLIKRLQPVFNRRGAINREDTSY